MGYPNNAEWPYEATNLNVQVELDATSWKFVNDILR